MGGLAINGAVYDVEARSAISRAVHDVEVRTAIDRAESDARFIPRQRRSSSKEKYFGA